MLSKFRLELDVVLDADKTPSIIEMAKQRSEADAFTDEKGVTRTIGAAEFVHLIEYALTELVERNPLLVNADVEVERISCCPVALTEAPESPVQSAEISDDGIDDDDAECELEEYETGLYLCRWPNGEFSVVKADHRQDAVVQLDEWAGAEPTWLIPVETFMVDFRLNDGGEIELVEFSEETGEFLWENCYPELDEVLSCEDVLQHDGSYQSRKTADKIRKAVQHERKRLWNAQGNPTPAKTAMGRELQNRLRTVGAVADRYVEIAAEEILRAKGKGGNGKPN